MPEDTITFPFDMEFKLTPGAVEVNGKVYLKEDVDAVIEALVALKPFLARKDS